MSLPVTSEVKPAANLDQVKPAASLDQVAKVEAPPESDKEVNWNKFKEARAAERKQFEEYKSRAQEKEAEATALKAALESIVNKPTQQSQQSNFGQYNEEESEDVRKRQKHSASKERPKNTLKD